MCKGYRNRPLAAFERIKLKLSTVQSLKNLLTFYMYAIKRSFYDLTSGKQESQKFHALRRALPEMPLKHLRRPFSTKFAITPGRGDTRHISPVTCKHSLQASSGSYANSKIASFELKVFSNFLKRSTVFKTPS